MFEWSRFISNVVQIEFQSTTTVIKRRWSLNVERILDGLLDLTSGISFTVTGNVSEVGLKFRAKDVFFSW